jgi:hypothetical protein
VYGCYTETQQCSRGAYIIGLISLRLPADDLLIHVRSEVGKEGSYTLERVPSATRFVRSLGTKLPNRAGTSLHSHQAKNLTLYKLQTYLEWGGDNVVWGYNCMLETKAANFPISGEMQIN